MKHYDIALQDQDILKKGIDAIIDFYQTMSVETLRLSNLFVFATGIDSPFLNVVIDTGLSKEKSSDTINSISNFFAKHHVPWGWFITPAKHENDLIQQGFSLLEEAPAMYFDLANLSSLTKPEHIAIVAADKEDNLKTWIQPIIEGFQAPEGDDRYRKLNFDKSSTGKLRQFTAYYKNNLAAAGTLFLSNDSVMLHNLATKPAYTKHGIGTALTLHMMNEAKNLGFKHCFLDSSEDGFSLYKKIGFKIYSTTLIYAITSQSHS
jgi:GNAT superfamily N-acetyltransferase